MRAVAIDTWAFLELAREGPRGDEVAATLDATDFAFTTREVVAETFNHLVRRTGATRRALAWWDDMRESDVRVFEPPLDEVHAFITAHGRRGALSFVDLSLAAVATREDVKDILTEDAEFRQVGLVPIFATR